MKRLDGRGFSPIERGGDRRSLQGRWETIYCFLFADELIVEASWLSDSRRLKVKFNKNSIGCLKLDFTLSNRRNSFLTTTTTLISQKKNFSKQRISYVCIIESSQSNRKSIG